MNEFEEIYRKHHQGVYGFLFKLCGNAQLAEELTAETFYQAFISFRHYDGSCTVFTWLAAVGKNCYFKYLRKNAGKPENVSEEIASASAETEEELPDIVYEKKEMIQKVRNALATLPKKHRDVVVMRTYADLSFKEIGRALSISENSAKVLYFRAKNQLRKELKNEDLL